MAVYKRTYKVYEGPLTPAWSRFSILTRYSVSSLFDSRLFTGYTVLCLVPTLALIVFIYVTHLPALQASLKLQPDELPAFDQFWFTWALPANVGLSFFMVAWVAPTLIIKDFSNQAIQLYLSRPLARMEYLLGKIAVLAGLLSCITWVPSLILFGLQAQMEGNGWGWRHLLIPVAMMVGSWLWIGVVSLLALAFSVWVRSRITATALIFVVFGFLPGFAAVFDAILRTPWGNVFILTYVLKVVWAHLFAFSPQFIHARGLDQIPLWSAWASIGITCLVSFLLLEAKLRAREVERG